MELLQVMAAASMACVGEAPLLAVIVCRPLELRRVPAVVAAVSEMLAVDLDRAVVSKHDLEKGLQGVVGGAGVVGVDRVGDHARAVQGDEQDGSDAVDVGAPLA